MSGRQISLLCWRNPSPSEENAIKIANYLGLEMRTLRLTPEAKAHEEYLSRSIPSSGCIVATAETIADICEHGALGMGFLDLARRLAADVFLFGFRPIAKHEEILRKLTGGHLSGVEPVRPGDSCFSVEGTSPEICKQLGGVSFEAQNAQIDFAFTDGPAPAPFASLIRIREQTLFGCVQDSRGRVFLSSGDHIADLDKQVPRNTPRLHFFPELVPWMMFLRCALGTRCWHNDTPGACFIIDDPLLRRQYGFLDYDKLSALMDRQCFSTTIAFIPWNYRRSDPRVAEFLASRPDTYSLCVHGCDHAREEFGGVDYDFLREKAQQAVEWMTRHRALSGLDFDDVMVFPQGVFSTVAMRALDSCGYLAGVNSTPYPVDARDSITLGDLLQVAITRFSNIPLFIRRYPHRPAELAFDLFLGRPALVVEHHGFFRDGYNTLADTVANLHRLEKQLRWAGLAKTCSSACLRKVSDDGAIDVLFFTDRFSLRNDSDLPQDYTLIRNGHSAQHATALLVNGRPVDISLGTDALTARISLRPHEAVAIEVRRSPSERISVARSPDPIYQAKVFIRRSLSEFRDNVVAKNPLLRKAVRDRSA